MRCRALCTGGEKGIRRPPVRVKCGPGTYGLLTCPCRFESYSVHERKEVMREFKRGDRATWSAYAFGGHPVCVRRGVIIDVGERISIVLCDERNKEYLIPTPRLLPEATP